MKDAVLEGISSFYNESTVNDVSMRRHRALWASSFVEFLFEDVGYDTGGGPQPPNGLPPP